MFGHRMLAEWMLDPDVVYLNHGTVGATPRRVLAVQQAIRDRMERGPSQFLLREAARAFVHTPESSAPSLVREAASNVAAYFGCAGGDLVFVDNATTGVNAVLQSLELNPGDEILITDHGYGAIANAAAYFARRRGAHVVTVTVPYPCFDRGRLVDAVIEALGPRTRLAIFDHITSESALLLPLADLAAACRARGVPVLADGAHVPGAIPLDLPSTGVDWYAANLHKWAWAPRGCGFLWARPDRQSTLHPVVISWGLDEGYTEEFDWVGTRDPSPWLAAPEGLRYIDELGTSAVQAWNHELAWTAGGMLTEAWATELGVAEMDTGTMVTVPLPAGCGSTAEDATNLRNALLFEDAIEIQLHSWGGRLWTRVSAQVYNERSDIQHLADAVARRYQKKRMSP
jgi:isopenicillin-N epimerase